MDDSDAVVALGGTFDPIHDGHRALFDRAFSRGHVTIGLTSDDLAAAVRKIDRPVQPFETRLQNLADTVKPYAAEYGRQFIIRKLESPVGIADEPRFSILVVSPETAPTGGKINEIREAAGHETLDIDVVDHVRAEDGEIISSTRIVAGEIDEHGRIIE